jgi:hypothetical protein
MEIPYGYDKTDGTFDTDPMQAALLSAVLAEYLASPSVHAVARPVSAVTPNSTQ